MSVSTGNNFVEVDFSIQKIAVVKINRPEAKNALNSEVRKQLAQAFTELSFNDEINAVVLTGGEEVFAAGADLKEMATAQLPQKCYCVIPNVIGMQLPNALNP